MLSRIRLSSLLGAAFLLALLASGPPLHATDYYGCFVCIPVGGVASNSSKCWMVGDNENGDGIECDQNYDMLGWLCQTYGGPCNNGNSGGGLYGCWAEDCWSSGGGGGGGGGGGSCSVQTGTLCPAECFSCTYWYY